MDRKFLWEKVGLSRKHFPRVIRRQDDFFFFPGVQVTFMQPIESNFKNGDVGVLSAFKFKEKNIYIQQKNLD